MNITKDKNNIFGILSLLISCSSLFFIFISFMVAGFAEEASPQGLDEDSTLAAVLGLTMAGFTLLSIVSLTLGIYGVVKKEPNKTWSIFGVVISSIILIIAIITLLVAAVLEQDNYESISETEPNILIETYDRINPTFRIKYVEVKIKSLENDIAINNVIVNRGNCRIENKNFLTGRPILPKKLKFGQTISISFSGPCEALEVEVFTNIGSLKNTY